MGGGMRRQTMWLAALILISLATRWLSLAVDVVDLDETCHIVGSWQLMRGGLLYTDFVDNKPPLLYAYYAAAQVLGGRGLFAVHLLTALCVVPLTALAVSACYRTRRTGMIAALTFLLYSAAFIGHDMLATNAEILMVLPASWAIVLMRDEDWTADLWRAVAAGLLLGIRRSVQTTNRDVDRRAARSPSPARRRSPPRVSACTAAGALIAAAIVPGLCALLYFWVRGGLGAFVYWAGPHNLWYADNPMTLVEAARRFGGTAIPFLLVTSPLWIGWWRGYSLPQPRHWRVLVTALVVASVPPVLLGFRFFPHYFIQLYVPLALAAAPWLEQQLAPITRVGRVVIVWTATVVVGFAIANAVLYFGPFHVYREREPVFRAVAQRLVTDPCARGGSVFVWGWAPMIYYDAGLPPASRFVAMAVSQLTGYLPGNLSSNRGESPAGREVPAHWDWLMQDLDRSHVTFIVDTVAVCAQSWSRYSSGTSSSRTSRVWTPTQNVSGTFHTRYHAGLEGVPFLKQFVDTFRIGALEVRQALQVSRLPA